MFGFDAVTVVTQPQYKRFVKLENWKAKYGNYVFSGPWPKCPHGYAHGVTAVA